MKVKLNPGVWEWKVRDVETKKSLTGSLGRVEIVIHDTEVDLPIPEFLDKKVKPEIFVWRTR